MAIHGKFKNLSATQILHEINFVYFQVSKNAILTILYAIDFNLGKFHLRIQMVNLHAVTKIKIQNEPKVYFCLNFGGRKCPKFPHCVFDITCAA